MWLDVAVLGPSLRTLAVCSPTPAPTQAPHPLPAPSTLQKPYAQCAELTIVGATLYPSPEKDPLERATVKLSGAKIIRTVTRLAHARGAFVVSHPTQLSGLVNAVDNGVDILSQRRPRSAISIPPCWSACARPGLVLIPTLELWRWDSSAVWGLFPKRPCGEELNIQRVGIVS
jgi:hypothetical protein